MNIIECSPEAFSLTLIKKNCQNDVKLSQTLFWRCATSEETLNFIGRENSQSKSSSLIKDFEPVNEFFLSTEIRLKNFNESSFIYSGETKRRTTKLPEKSIVNLLLL